MQQAEQGICKTDLILLTHAGCAFKDPRGRFGISYPAAVRNCVYGPQSAGDAAEVQPLIAQTVQPTDFTLRLAAAFGQTQQRGLRYQSALEGP